MKRSVCSLFSGLSDEELVRKSRNDLSVFECLLQRYEGKLLKYILRISHVPYEKAEEILQEVFVKVWKNLNEFDSHLKFSSWIYRIAHNEVISEFRKYQARHEGEQVSWEDEHISSLPSKVDLPSELHRKLNAEKVQKVLKFLSPKYRSVLVLRFLDEKSYKEISDIMRIPEGTVATFLHRAKKSFEQAAQNAHIYF